MINIGSGCFVQFKFTLPTQRPGCEFHADDTTKIHFFFAITSHGVLIFICVQPFYFVVAVAFGWFVYGRLNFTFNPGLEMFVSTYRFSFGFEGKQVSVQQPMGWMLGQIVGGLYNSTVARLIHNAYSRLQILTP